MLKDKDKLLFYLISILFIAVNLALIAYDFYYIAFLPVILLFVLAGIVSLDKILLTIVFFTPLSIELTDLVPSTTFNLSLPTEPILAGVLFLFLFKVLHDGTFDKKVLIHPVSIAIFINLFWIFITSLTSTMPVVSLKFFASRLWFVIAMYFLATQLFRKYQNIEKFNWLYIVSLVVVIFYTNYRLSLHGFDNQMASNWVVWPFFNDHTSYGAMLVLFLFPLYYYMTKRNENLLLKLVIRFTFLLFAVAIVFSYTRAAWLSLFAGIGFWGIVKLKIKTRTVLIAGFALIIIFLAIQEKIFQGLERNESESSGKFSEHIESMANITSDASNVERLNRWKCAIRMFKEKPFWGWGPGTYSFQYAPFQFSYDRSSISTNFGDMGNAHSEYLGPLAESGVIGLLSFLLIIFMAFRAGFRVYHNAASKDVKELSLYIMLGLSTYFIHGVLNNFLDSDKASVPVWGFMAMLVALDVSHARYNGMNG